MNPQYVATQSSSCLPFDAAESQAPKSVVAACGGSNNAGDVEEFVVVDPVPVTIEPTFSGKYN